MFIGKPKLVDPWESAKSYLNIWDLVSYYTGADNQIIKSEKVTNGGFTSDATTTTNANVAYVTGDKSGNCVMITALTGNNTCIYQ